MLPTKLQLHPWVKDALRPKLAILAPPTALERYLARPREPEVQAPRDPIPLPAADDWEEFRRPALCDASTQTPMGKRICGNCYQTTDVGIPASDPGHVPVPLQVLENYKLVFELADIQHEYDRRERELRQLEREVNHRLGERYLNLQKKVEEYYALRPSRTDPRTPAEIEEAEKRILRRIKNGECFICERVGHDVALCPRRQDRPPPNICYRCGEVGFRTEYCPNWDTAFHRRKH